ncbi:MAG: TetR/AcrR family transcriptional regulator C-terminal domain-containing protein [Actinomycetota bacterium]
MARQVDRDAIVETARGLDPAEVNLRNVGRALGVTGQALYTYVSGTEELRELVAATAWPPTSALPDADLAWDHWWPAALRLLRMRLLDVSDLAAALGGQRVVTDDQIRFAERGIATLVAAGVAAGDALLLYRVLVHATIDHVARIGRANPDYVERFWDAVEASDSAPTLTGIRQSPPVITAEDAFAIQLDVLIDGIRRRYLDRVPTSAGSSPDDPRSSSP